MTLLPAPGWGPVGRIKTLPREPAPAPAPAPGPAPGPAPSPGGGATSKPGESVHVGTHGGPRIPNTSGRPLVIVTREGIVGAGNGYTRFKMASDQAGLSSDMDAPAHAVVQFGKRYFVQAVDIVNEIGSHMPYRPDELADFGDLKVRISNPAVKAVIDGWTEITADGIK